MTNPADVTSIPVCTKIVPGSSRGYAAPCVRAAEHDGACLPDALALRYGPGRLTDKDADWLRSEIAMLHGQIASENRRHREYERTLGRSHRRLLARLINLAPANSARKTVPLNAVRDAWQEAVNG